MQRKHSLPVAAVLAVSCLGIGAAGAEQSAETHAQKRVSAAAQSLKDHPRLKGMSDDRRKALVEFVMGNTLFVMLHEMGHVVVRELGLPVLGRDEDAADAFGAVVALQMHTQFSERVLIEAAKGWFLSDRRDKKEGNPMEFYDEHGLDLQRAYNIVCLMVGSDPKKFKPLADHAKIPEERQETCVGDYSNASWSWETVLKPHRREAEDPKVTIEVSYSEPGGKYEHYYKSFKDMRLLDTIAEHASEKFKWPKPFKIEARACDVPNANWDAGSRTLFLCYELAADFAELFVGYNGELTEKEVSNKKGKRTR